MRSTHVRVSVACALAAAALAVPTEAPVPAASAEAAPQAAGVAAPAAEQGVPAPATPSPGNPTKSASAVSPLPPTRVLGLPSASLRDGTRALRVLLSAPVAPGSPAPTFSPAVAGMWTASGALEIFKPAVALAPCSTYRLIVWARTQSLEHAPLARTRSVVLHVACPPVAGLQEALARLGYLDAALVPARGLHLPSARESAREAALLAFDPARGSLPADPWYAPAVRFGWLDATTRGALMVYQSLHGLDVTGEPDRETWSSLLAAESAYRRDPRPYTWVTVSESSPETLEVHEGDRVALSSPANTGVAGAETERGTFPIYSRLLSTTMSGTDPDGVHYDVPDVPWVNYFNGGDAVHGYPRASYGSPQSNGCVELPIDTARYVYGMLQIGDIVEVMG